MIICSSSDRIAAQERKERMKQQLAWFSKGFATAAVILTMTAAMGVW